jgi:hypothetical protein
VARSVRLCPSPSADIAAITDFKNIMNITYITNIKNIMDIRNIKNIIDKSGTSWIEGNVQQYRMNMFK